ncbi:MAG: SAF domain-containing protein [Actinomycetota bacterium]|nr:SAF domain-containing protein [Actinomycetota bacterium]
MRLHRLLRSPLLFWAAVALLAVLTAIIVGRAMGRARSEAAHWGSVRDVAVTTDPVAAGTAVRAGDVVVRSMPAAFLPDGAMSSLDEVVAGPRCSRSSGVRPSCARPSPRGA